ncbi:MAG: DNA replication/repair protein RecF [Candidatus Saccharimonadales bacterium]
MISSIRLQQFRTYTDATFQFSPEVTIVAGSNASGKTNLLEAVLVASQGGSFRVKDYELIRHGKDWARLDAETAGGKRTVKIAAAPPQKSFEFDGQVFKRLPRQHTLPVVLFEPNHMQMFFGAPELRRNFMDDLLEQTSPRFGEYRRHYKRVLTQRNALLKKRQPHQLFVWNIRLSELGGKIARERARLVDVCNQQVSQLYSDIAGKPTVIGLRYQTQLPLDAYETALLSSLERNEGLDVARGFTANGPHRDDLAAEIGGKPFQQIASRGETRTLALALKVIELQLLESKFAAKPLLLLDDVFSELDSNRRAALTRLVTRYQTIITTTNDDLVAPQLKTSSVILLDQSVSAL